METGWNTRIMFDLLIMRCVQHIPNVCYCITCCECSLSHPNRQPPRVREKHPNQATHTPPPQRKEMPSNSLTTCLETLYFFLLVFVIVSIWFECVVIAFNMLLLFLLLLLWMNLAQLTFVTEPSNDVNDYPQTSSSMTQSSIHIWFFFSWDPNIFEKCDKEMLLTPRCKLI